MCPKWDAQFLSNFYPIFIYFLGSHPVDMSMYASDTVIRLEYLGKMKSLVNVAWTVLRKKLNKLKLQ